MYGDVEHFLFVIKQHPFPHLPKRKQGREGPTRKERGKRRIPELCLIRPRV